MKGTLASRRGVLRSSFLATSSSSSLICTTPRLQTLFASSIQSPVAQHNRSFFSFLNNLFGADKQESDEEDKEEKPRPTPHSDILYPAPFKDDDKLLQQSVAHFKSGGRSYYLLGVVSGSTESNMFVEKMFDKVQPDSVVVDLPRGVDYDLSPELLQPLKKKIIEDPQRGKMELRLTRVLPLDPWTPELKERLSKDDNWRSGYCAQWASKMPLVMPPDQLKALKLAKDSPKVKETVIAGPYLPVEFVRRTTRFPLINQLGFLIATPIGSYLGAKLPQSIREMPSIPIEYAKVLDAAIKTKGMTGNLAHDLTNLLEINLMVLKALKEAQGPRVLCVLDIMRLPEILYFWEKWIDVQSVVEQLHTGSHGFEAVQKLHAMYYADEINSAHEFHITKNMYEKESTTKFVGAFSGQEMSKEEEKKEETKEKEEMKKEEKEEKEETKKEEKEEKEETKKEEKKEKPTSEGGEDNKKDSPK